MASNHIKTHISKLLLTIVFLNLIFKGQGQSDCGNVLSSSMYIHVDLDSVITQLESSRDEVDENFNFKQWSCIKRKLSIAYFRNGLYQMSLAELEQVRKSKNMDKSSNLFGICCVEIGNIHKQDKKFDLALSEYLVGVEILKKNKAEVILGVVYTTIGEYYRSINQYEEAIDYVEKAIDLFDNGDQYAYFYYKAVGRKAAILNEINQPKLSIQLSKKVLNYGKEQKNFELQTLAHNEMGFSYLNLIKNDSSIYHYQEAENIYSKFPPSIENAHVKYNIAVSFSRTSDESDPKLRDSAIILFHGVRYYVLSNKLDYPLYSTNQYLLTQHHYLKHYDSALYYQKLFYEDLNEFEKKKADKKIFEIQAYYKNDQILLEKEQVDNELKLAEAENREKNFQNKIILFIVFLILIILMIIGRLFYISHKNNTILQEKNKEKDILIKEINHRVKNNMQMVSSLLDIQSVNIKDENTKASLKEAGNRINSLALAHQKLYVNEDFSNIQLLDYITLIGNSLLLSSKTQIEIEVKKEIILEIEKAQALGFIINELITNSLKHAWELEDEIRLIKIEIIKKGFDWELHYKDNGKGLPEDFDINNLDSIGVKLIQSFVGRQLEGSLEFINNLGCEVKIKFQYKNK